MEKIVYLIPAPDMDERSIRAIQLDGCEVIPVVLPPIDFDTRLESYVRDLAGQIATSRPVLLGACYGGPLALEIAKVIATDKVIVAAGVCSRDELTTRWKLLYRFYLLLPSWFETAIGVSLRFVINRVLRINVKIPRLWLKGGQNRFIARHLLSLEAAQSTRVVRVHGSKDRIFPLDRVAHIDFVIDGGHFMLDKNRRAALTAISQALTL